MNLIQSPESESSPGRGSFLQLPDNCTYQFQLPQGVHRIKDLQLQHQLLQPVISAINRQFGVYSNGHAKLITENIVLTNIIDATGNIESHPESILTQFGSMFDRDVFEDVQIIHNACEARYQFSTDSIGFNNQIESNPDKEYLKKIISMPFSEFRAYIIGSVRQIDQKFAILENIPNSVSRYGLSSLMQQLEEADNYLINVHWTAGPKSTSSYLEAANRIRLPKKLLYILSMAALSEGFDVLTIYNSASVEQIYLEYVKTRDGRRSDNPDGEGIRVIRELASMFGGEVDIKAAGASPTGRLTIAVPLEQLSIRTLLKKVFNSI